MSNLYKSIILLGLLTFIGFAYYNYRANTYVTAEFPNLRPFHDRAPIFYNGYKIGRVVRVKPNKDYSATIVTMELHPQDLKLPINIMVHLKKEKNKDDKKFDYIDIIYPEKPSMYLLKDGDRIAGKTTVDFETYMANQDPDSLDAIKRDVAEAAANLNVTIQALGDLFTTLNSMAEEIKPNVVNASSSLSKSSDNLVTVSEHVSSFAGNINSSFNEERLNANAENIQDITNGIKTITSEVNRTLPNFACTIEETNRVLCNLEEMTSGLNCTMKKPFGGLRLIFGSPICKRKCE